MIFPILAITIIMVSVGLIPNHAYAFDKRSSEDQNNSMTMSTAHKVQKTNESITAFVQSVNPQSKEHKSNLFDIVIKVVAGKEGSSNQTITVKSDSSSTTFFITPLKAYESRIIHVGLIMKNPDSAQIKL